VIEGEGLHLSRDPLLYEAAHLQDGRVEAELVVNRKDSAGGSQGIAYGLGIGPGQCQGLFQQQVPSRTEDLYGQRGVGVIGGAEADDLYAPVFQQIFDRAVGSDPDLLLPAAEKLRGVQLAKLPHAALLEGALHFGQTLGKQITNRRQLGMRALEISGTMGVADSQTDYPRLHGNPPRNSSSICRFSSAAFA
jgi:hypothetical protein